MERSRRTFVKSGAGLVALSALAGCSEGDAGSGNGNGNGDTDSEPEPEADTAVVTVLAENLSGGHDHSEDHDDHNDDHDDHDELVSQAVIEESCGHMEFDEPETLVGGVSADETPVINGTHQPFDVSVEGDSAFITYDADADSGHDHDDDHEDHEDDHEDEHGDDHHDDDHDDGHDDDHHDDEHDDDHDEHDDENGMFGFFARGGGITVHTGELHDESHEVECDAVDMYVVVEPDHGAVTLELTRD